MKSWMLSVGGDRMGCTIRAFAAVYILLNIISVESALAVQIENSADTLRLIPSELALRASGVTYSGQPAAPSELEKGFLTEFEYGPKTYIQTKILGPLLVRHETTGELRHFSMFDLAVSAGWLSNVETIRLPGAIRGLGRAGNTLWMGSNGVGVVSLDMERDFWTRYDTKDIPVPGDHRGVSWTDDDYTISGTDIYSHAERRWMRLDEIPMRFVSSLGYEDSPLVAVTRDDRIYAGATKIPARFREVVLLGNHYRFRIRFSNDSITEFWIPKSALDTAFLVGD